MIIRALSFLLHHANRESKSDRFYAIKKKLLQEYGELVGHDVQHIPGNKCNSCGGSGQHAKYSYSGKIYDWADCYHCQLGWYKLPQWNILERYRLGRYIFHQPLKRVYSKEQIHVPFECKIEGYIEHNYSKYGADCLMVLYFIFDFKRWWKEDFKIIRNKRTIYFKEIMRGFKGGNRTKFIAIKKGCSIGATESIHDDLPF